MVPGGAWTVPDWVAAFLRAAPLPLSMAPMALGSSSSSCFLAFSAAILAASAAFCL
jgi:hypothetical protein